MRPLHNTDNMSFFPITYNCDPLNDLFALGKFILCKISRVMLLKCKPSMSTKNPPKAFSLTQNKTQSPFNGLTRGDALVSPPVPFSLLSVFRSAHLSARLLIPPRRPHGLFSHLRQVLGPWPFYTTTLHPDSAISYFP